MAEPTFKDLENAGWSHRAADYDNQFAPVTRRAIDPILDSLAPQWAGQRFLDICCGTGHLAGSAAARGAEAEGLDFAAPMVRMASRNFPDLVFTQGDAEKLPYAGESFDFAACAFGVLHLDDPDAGLREGFRILKPSGRYAFTTWLPPERGFDLYRIITPAIQIHGVAEACLPTGPPMFRLADPVECERVLREIGFVEIRFTEQCSLWRGGDGDAVLGLIYKGIVRTPMLIDRQPAGVRARILAAILDGAEGFRKDDAIELRWPYLLAVATKPA
jgi:SAM-dependent methyltransferase